MKKQFSKLLAGVVISAAVMGQAWAAEKVTVFAAASLTNAVDEISAKYKQEKKGEVVASYASSSTLARQIENGAPADIFISADQKWMDYAQEKNLIINDTRKTLLGNELVLIAAKDSKIDKVDINKQTDWVKLLDGGRLAVGDPDHVPVGIYAQEAWKTWAPGKWLIRCWPVLIMCAAAWRWWSAVKRRWVSCTALTRLPVIK